MKKINIKIKCRIYNSIDTNKYRILIYDDDCNLICDKYTNEYGILNYEIYEGVYQIVVISNYKLCPKINVVTALFYSECCHILLIYFNYIYNKHLRPITITLTDKFYQGLPIEKGELTLWQNHM